MTLEEIKNEVFEYDDVRRELFEEEQKFFAIPSSRYLYDGFEPLQLDVVLSMNKNLEKLGYSMSKTLIDTLSRLEDRGITIKLLNDLYVMCKEKSGADFQQGELFYPNFPEDVMNMTDAELYYNAQFAYLTGEIFGANARFTEEPTERIPTFDNKELKIITEGNETDVEEMMEGRIFYGKVLPDIKREGLYDYLSKNEKWRNHIIEEIKKRDIPIKENKVRLAAYIYENCEDKSVIYSMLRDSTDILRFAALLSNPENPNIELKGHVQFNLSKPEQRMIKLLLSECKGLYHDIWTREGLYRSLGRVCSMTKNCPPRLKKAYDNLHDGKKVDEKNKPISTTWIELNKAFIAAENNDIGTIRRFAETYPGLFGKNFHSIMQKTTGLDASTSNILQNKILDILQKVGKDITPDTIFKIMNQAPYIGNTKPSGFKERVVHHGKTPVVEKDLRLPYSKEILDKINNVCEQISIEYFREMGEGENPWGTDEDKGPWHIYIDPEMKNVLLPGNDERDMSKGSNLTRGSSIDGIKDANILQMAIHWSEDCDIDAHFFMYNKQIGLVNNCSFYDLKARGENGQYLAVHSGDFTCVSPKQRENGGVLESIWLDKQACKNNGIKYVAMYVHGYNAPGGFKESDCSLAVMQRQGNLNNLYVDTNNLQDSDNPIQDVERLTNEYFKQPVVDAKLTDYKIDLNSPGSFCVPAIYDIENDKLIWLDKSIGLSEHYSSQGYEGLVNCQDNAMLEMISTIDNVKGNMYQLFEAYAIGRGYGLTDDIKEADIVVSRTNIDETDEGICPAQVITANDLSYIAGNFMTRPKAIDSGKDEKHHNAEIENSEITKEIDDKTLNRNGEIIQEAKELSLDEVLEEARKSMEHRKRDVVTPRNNDSNER